MSNFFSGSLAAPGAASTMFEWGAVSAPPSAQPGWSVPDALLFILFSAATADGRLSHQEHETLMAALPRSRAVSALSQEALEAANLRVLEHLRAGKPDTLEAAASALPEDLRLPAFAHALDMTLADGDLVPAEAAFLNALAAALGLAAADVHRIADVLLLKNRI